MRATICPHCRRLTYVEDRAVGFEVRCDYRACGKTYVAGGPHLAPDATDKPVWNFPTRAVDSYGPAGPPPLIDDDPPSTSTLPRLTDKHHCMSCFDPRQTDGSGLLPDAFGRRRWVTIHRNPHLTQPCRTDVYAAIYHCPRCLALLETPSHQWGRQVRCPVETCGRSFVAPREDVLHRHAGDHHEGIAYVFTCPACSRHLRCDTVRNQVPTSGTVVVCIHPECRQCIEVPPVGRPASPAPSVPGPVEAVQAVARRPCGRCGLKLPTNIITCPICRFQNEPKMV